MDMMDKILYKYKNGDYHFTIYEDGTLIRETNVINPTLEFPSSIDVKTTNACNLNCPYCHEQSTINGKHADLERLQEILDVLPAGVECALGGGNILMHPDLYWFLQWLKNKGIIANITVNQYHLIEYKELIYILLKEDLIKGLGISIVNNDYTEIIELQKLTNNIVFHVIAGVTKLTQLNDLLNLKYCKILVLGYKQFGRGIDYYNSDIELEITLWKDNLRKYVNKGTLSFDNLAIEQLDIKSWFTEAGWNKFYMGDDFTFTMYIDAVEQNYAPTSRDSNRTSFDKMDLLTYFKTRNNGN
jgi:MoaA/NifB/PqqE/SkfB family radical SAM enzyme